MAETYASDSAVVVSRGASYLTLQTVVTSLAQVIAFAVLARIITPAEVGVLAILTLITALTLAINGTAFQQAAIKFVGEYAGTAGDLAAGVFYETLQLSIIVSVPMAIVIFLGSGLLAGDLLGSISQAGLFRVLALDVLAFAGVQPVAMGAVLGAKRFKAAAAIGTGGAVLRQFLIIVLILFMKNFIGLVYAWAVSDFAMFVVFGLYAVRVLGLAKTAFPLRRLLNFSWPLSIGNVVNFAYSWFDRAILIALVPLASLGVYNAALYAFGALYNISGAFGNALLPVYSKIGASRGPEGCRKATQAASRYVSLVTVPLAFGLLATAKPALTLFVGEAYLGGVVPLMVLSFAFGLTAVTLALTPMLTALAKTRELMWITVASTALGLFSAYIVLPFMGIVGASVARDIATFAILALTIFVLERVGAMGIDVEMAWKSLAAGAAMAAAIIAIQMLIYSRILLPVYVVIGVIVYMLLLRVLHAVRMHDIELIERYLGPRLEFVARLLCVILVNGGTAPKTH